MLQSEPLILLLGIIAATPWIATIILLRKRSCKKIDPFTNGYIIAAFLFTTTIILSSLQSLPVTSFIEAYISLSYTVSYLGGVTSILYVLLKVYYPRKLNQQILLTVSTLALLTKIYDHIDWAVTPVPYPEEVLTISHTLIVLLTVSWIILTVKAYRIVKIEILKTRLKLLAFAAILILIEVLIIVVPGTPLYDYWWLTGAILVTPFSILGALAVTYKHEYLDKLIGLETGGIKGTREEKTIAILTKHTSKEGSCEYYDPNLKSKCKLDPSSYRLEDCKGLKYRNGFICPKILRQERKQQDA